MIITVTIARVMYLLDDVKLTATVGNNLSSGDGRTGTLVIPSTVTDNGKSYTVDAIGIRAFYGCGGLTGALTIPDSVTSIGDYAFFDCSGFTGTLTIPDKVTRIGDFAFTGCYGLKSVTILSSIATIGDRSFSACSDVVSAYLWCLAPANTLSAFGGASTTIYVRDNAGWGDTWGGCTVSKTTIPIKHNYSVYFQK